MQDDPYLEYGKDPVLKEERVTVRATSTNLSENQNKPDITHVEEGRKRVARYPDLVTGENYMTCFYGRPQVWHF